MCLAGPGAAVDTDLDVGIGSTNGLRDLADDVRVGERVPDGSTRDDRSLPVSSAAAKSQAPHAYGPVAVRQVIALLRLASPPERVLASVFGAIANPNDIEAHSPAFETCNGLSER